MPTEVTTSNAAEDIVRAVQMARAPGSVQVRSSLHAIHLLIVPTNQLVLPNLEPHVALELDELRLALDSLQALHGHAQTMAAPEVSAALKEAGAHLEALEIRGLEGYLNGLFAAMAVARNHLEHHPSPPAETVVALIGACVTLASQLWRIVHLARRT